MACLCNKSDVGPITVFETVTAGKKFYNADMKCEFAGNKITEMIERGEISEEQAINDCVLYAKKIKATSKTTELHMLGWMCMHLALGLCHKFNIKDTAHVRGIMRDILPYCRGMDNGIFLRDVIALGEDEQFLSDNEKELLKKAMYYLKIASGFKIDMRNEDFARSVYGPLKKTLPEYAYYIDLPVGNPAYAIGTAPTSVAGPLLTAVEGMKPFAVLTLLRYGATAHGEAMNYILASLSYIKTVGDKTKHKAADSPLEKMKLILRYLLRAVNTLRLRFDDQKIGDMDHDDDVYYVSQNIEHFLEEHFYKSPNHLKQICRTRIRNLVRDNNSLPEGLYTFPKLITTHKRYLDLLA